MVINPPVRSERTSTTSENLFAQHIKREQHIKTIGHNIHPISTIPVVPILFSKPQTIVLSFQIFHTLDSRIHSKKCTAYSISTTAHVATENGFHTVLGTFFYNRIPCPGCEYFLRILSTPMIFLAGYSRWKPLARGRQRCQPAYTDATCRSSRQSRISPGATTSCQRRPRSLPEQDFLALHVSSTNTIPLVPNRVPQATEYSTSVHNFSKTSGPPKQQSRACCCCSA